MFQRYPHTYIVADDPASYSTPIPEPVYFWFSSRKDIVKLRKKFLIQWILSSIQLWLLIFLMCAIYFGTGQNPSQYTNRLDVDIINYDGDLAGTYFLNAFRQTAPGSSTLNWLYKDASDYNHNIDEIKRVVENGHVWASVVLRTNTTRLVNESLLLFINTTTLLISPFVSTPAVLVLYEDGRNSFTVNNFVLPPIRAALAMASARYGQVLRRDLFNRLTSSSNSSDDRKIQLMNTFKLGSLLVDPLAAKYQNLHPAYPFVGQLSTTLGYIYIYLISGMIVGSGLTFITPFIGKIRVIDILVYRVVNGFFQAFIISLIYSLIVLWLFGINSGRLFMRFWMFNWLSAMIFGIIVVTFTVNFGLFANFFLIIFFILMLATGTFQLTLELSSRFYLYGYGLPFYHIVNGSRHLLFNSYSYFALDVGVLLVYFGIFWIVAVTTSAYWMKRKERKIIEEKQRMKTRQRKYSIAIISK